MIDDTLSVNSSQHDMERAALECDHPALRHYERQLSLLVADRLSFEKEVDQIKYDYEMQAQEHDDYMSDMYAHDAECCPETGFHPHYAEDPPTPYWFGGHSVHDSEGFGSDSQNLDPDCFSCVYPEWNDDDALHEALPGVVCRNVRPSKEIPPDDRRGKCNDR